MPSLTFERFQCHSDRRLVDQKHAIEYVLAFAGILDLSADKAVFDTGLLSNYEDYDTGVWSDGLGAASGSSGWYPCTHTTEIAGSFSATFTKTGQGGFMFAGDSSDTFHTIWWNNTNVGVSQITDGAETVLTSVPCTESGEADVTVGVYYQSHTSIDTIDDITAGLWFDDKLLLAFAFPHIENNGKLGFAQNDDWEGTFQDLTIYDAHTIVPWTSVDPGESAATGLSRVTAYTKLKLLARYDGSVRLYLGGYHVPDWTVPVDRSIQIQQQFNVYWQSHLRTVGALHEVDTFREGNQGHVFSVQNDPNALTSAETELKGARLHKSVEENAESAIVTMPPNVLLEPGDIVELDGLDWRVVTIEYTLGWESGEGTVLHSRVQLVRALDE